jgi:hypothetical protein
VTLFLKEGDIESGLLQYPLNGLFVTTMARGDPDPASKGQPATMICAGIAV